MKTIYILNLLIISIFSSCNKDEPTIINENPTVAQEQMNVSYGTDSKQTFDLFLPANRSSKTTKTLILIHGGGWVGGDKADMIAILSLVRNKLPNYAIVNMNYRLATADKPAFPMQIDDIALVINKLKSENYKISKDFGLIGISAGAHLSMLYGYGYNTDKNIKMVASLVGPANFTDSNYLTNGENDIFTFIFGATYSGNETLYRQNSPLFRATNVSPPTLLLYGNEDPLVPITQGQDMFNKLNSLGVYNEFKLYNGGHLTWSASDFTDAETRIINFIKKKF